MILRETSHLQPEYILALWRNIQYQRIILLNNWDSFHDKMILDRTLPSCKFPFYFLTDLIKRRNKKRIQKNKLKEKEREEKRNGRKKKRNKERKGKNGKKLVSSQKGKRAFFLSIFLLFSLQLNSLFFLFLFCSDFLFFLFPTKLSLFIISFFCFFSCCSFFFFLIFLQSFDIFLVINSHLSVGTTMIELHSKINQRIVLKMSDVMGNTKIGRPFLLFSFLSFLLLFVHNKIK